MSPSVEPPRGGVYARRVGGALSRRFPDSTSSAYCVRPFVCGFWGWGERSCGAAGGSRRGTRVVSGGQSLRSIEGGHRLWSMATTKVDSRSQTARARARQAMADELERARRRESKLVAVFSAIDAREEAEAALGRALVELRDLGVAQTELAGMTGLSSREVAAAIRSDKDNAGADSDEPATDTSSENDHTDDASDRTDESTPAVPEHTYG